MKIAQLFLTLFICFISHEVSGFYRSNGRDSDGISLYLSCIFLVIYVLYQLKRQFMFFQAKKALIKAHKNDPNWGIESLKQNVTNTFYSFYESWSKKDLQLITPLLDPEFLIETQQALKINLNGKINIINNLVLDDMKLISVNDINGQTGDMFAMEIKSQMINYTQQESDGQFVSSTLSRARKETHEAYADRAQTNLQSFREYWVFKRTEDRWLLWDIKKTSHFFADLLYISEKDFKNVLKIFRSSKKQQIDFFYKKHSSSIHNYQNNTL